MQYIPFLKTKKYEMLAVRRLPDDLRTVTPFFDIPRPSADELDEAHVKANIQKGVKNVIPIHEQSNFSFYLDSYDIPEYIQPDGMNLYQ